MIFLGNKLFDAPFPHCRTCARRSYKTQRDDKEMESDLSTIGFASTGTFLHTA